MIRKFILILFLLISSLIILTGCQNPSFLMYYNLSIDKGLEVYCWEDNESWDCILMSGTNRHKYVDEVNNLQKISLSY